MTRDYQPDHDHYELFLIRPEKPTAVTTRPVMAKRARTEASVSLLEIIVLWLCRMIGPPIIRIQQHITSRIAFARLGVSFVRAVLGSLALYTAIDVVSSALAGGVS